MSVAVEVLPCAARHDYVAMFNFVVIDSIAVVPTRPAWHSVVRQQKPVGDPPAGVRFLGSRD